MASPVKTIRTQQAAAGFTEVVERGKGYIKSRNPATGAFTLDAVVGGRGFHSGAGPFTQADEIDTAWTVGDSTPYRRRMLLADYNAYAGLNDTITFNAGQIVKYVHPASGANVTFQPQNLQWTNDLDQIQTAGSVGAINATITDDLLRWTNAFGAGRHFEWRAQATHLTKRLIVDTLASLPTPNSTILAGANPVLRLQFIFQKSAGVDIYVGGVLWNENANNPQTTSDVIEFRSGATVLWAFAPAIAFDSSASKTLPVVVQRERKQGANLFVEIRVPWSWIQTAVFPITIDPTIDASPGASADDATQVDTGSAGVLTSSQPNIWSGRKYGGFRFPSITLASTDTITTSYIRLYAFAFYAFKCTLHGLLGNTAAFTTAVNDITGRSTTTASVSCDATWTANVYNDSPSINSVVSEIIAGTWASGNAMGIRLFYISPGDFEYDAYDLGESDKYPILHIVYTTAAAAGRKFQKASVLGV